MKIFLRKNEERRIKKGHLWVFSNEIEKIVEDEHSDFISRLYDCYGKFIALGFYNKHSLISFRILTYKDEIVDKNFFLQRMKFAEKLRLRSNTCGSVYRLINSEADFLPGLIIDKFDDKYALQIFSSGMEHYKEQIVDILVENFSASYIVEKNNNNLREIEGLEKKEGILFDNRKTDIPFIVEIDGIKYIIDLLKGQKTGFYLDQKDNRKKIRYFINKESKVLDLFCNEGGFSLNAALITESKITAVDSSEYALSVAFKNANLNNINNIDFVQSDVFDFIKEANENSVKYDIIILDPPSFTKSKRSIKNALKGYITLNSNCMRLLRNGGILFTYTCSHYITKELFEDVLAESSLKVGKKTQIIDYSECSTDHPIIPFMPETKYIKGFILRVFNL